MVLITGSKGQLGSALVSYFKKTGIIYVACDIEDFDITNIKETEEFIVKHKPQHIIHCAAFTEVEVAQKDPFKCFQANYLGTNNLVECALQIDATLIYISTDYVFDGEKDTPYEISDRANPTSHYGLSKYLGELAIIRKLEKCFIVRISWLFGSGKNFVKSILSLANKKEIRVVNDQVGSPTYAEDLGPLLCEFLQSTNYGIYHASNEGYCTFFTWAQKIYEIKKIDTKIIPINSNQYPSEVYRPKNSRLSKKSLEMAGFAKLPQWEISLAKYLEKLEK